MRALAAILAAVCAAAGIHADEREPFEVSVHLQVDRSITSSVITARLKDETETLWRPYGVRLEWTDPRAAEIQARWFSVEAILAPRIEGSELPKGPMVLGRVAVEPDGPGTGPIRVSFDATERVLALRTTGQATMLRDHEVARALGRVLAHEIGHVLLGARSHNKAGLMRAVFRSDELAEANRVPFRLTCTDLGRLRRRIRLLTGIEVQLPVGEECKRCSARSASTPSCDAEPA